MVRGGGSGRIMRRSPITGRDEAPGADADGDLEPHSGG
jgi:hypothetical protein